jgi:small subunit ribosomal protein S6
MEENLKTYEGMFLLRSGRSDRESPDALEIVRKLIEKRKGRILEIKKWDERRLAYDIDRNKRGLYILAYFEAPVDSIARIKADSALSEELLRILILSAPEYAQGASEMKEEEPETTESRRP